LLERSREKEIRAARMEANRDETGLPKWRNLEEALHLSDNKTPGLHRHSSARELSLKRIVEMKDQFYATVRQDSLPRRVIGRAIAFQRPDAFYKGREGWGDCIFTITRLAHYVVDLSAFVRSHSRGLVQARNGSMSAIGLPRSLMLRQNLWRTTARRETK
jgi:hypothetical protein